LAEPPAEGSTPPPQGAPAAQTPTESTGGAGTTPEQQPAAPTPANPCQSPSQQGSSMIEIPVGPLMRNAVLHLPAAPSGHPLALVIALHGYGGDGERFERDTGFSTLADKDGFAVLYPSSHGAQWAVTTSTRDVVFISDLLNRVEQIACIDPRRIYATGVSNGGRMAAMLGCVLSDRIAAIAPVAGGYRSLPRCEPDRPVSVLEIHGTADTTVPYEGSGPAHEGAVLPYVFGWAARDGCVAQPTVRKIALHTVRYVWSGCRGATSVQHLRIYKGRHGLPGAAGAEISSGGPHTISGIEQIWDFFAPLVLAPSNAEAAQSTTATQPAAAPSPTGGSSAP
jgi:polyhydroxybutyrate depolymerase